MWEWILTATALAVAAVATVSALRHRILARMAIRNAWRRPRQTATVVAGLMVGTAIISAALVAGDSAGYAIRGYVYQSMGHIDESATIRGYPYFSEEVYRAFQEDPTLAPHVDGITAFAIWEGAASSPRTGLYEPSIYLVGFDTSSTAGFGRFEGERPTTGSTLGTGQALVSDHLADELDLAPGDSVALSFTTPVDPAVPEIHPLGGTLVSVGQNEATASTHTIDVGPGATRITAVVGSAGDLPLPLPTPAPTTPMTLELVDPSGTVVARSGPGNPAWLNHSASPEDVLPQGAWTLRIVAQAAAQQYEGAAVVLHPVYDLERLRERARALQEAGMPDLSPFTKPKEETVTVDRIVHGGRADMFDFRMAVFLPLDDVQQMLGRPNEVNYIAFSNPGGVEDGVAHTDEAFAAINASLAAIKQQYPGVPAVQAIEAEAEKRQFLAVADDAGQTMKSLLVFAGSLSIITGLLLILNIFTMLAEERRSELGMARAVGLGRRDLVRLFVYEGALYAVAAAALGAILGLGLAYIMIVIMNAVIAQLGEGLSIPPVSFRPTLQAVLAAFSVGVLLTFATIWAASYRQAGLNIVRAIRRIEEPDRQGGRRSALLFGPLAALLGAALLLLGWLPLDRTGQFTLIVLAPLLLLAGIGAMLRPVLKRRVLYPGLAAVALVYYTATIFAIRDFADVTEANLIGPVRGVLIALAAVVLLVYFERGTRFVGRALARIPRLRAIGIPAVSYPLHRKFRTGMTLAMFALVILSIGFFSIFGALFDTDPDRQTGGFDIEARTTLVVDDIDAYRRPGADLPIEVRHELRDWATEDPDFITVNGDRTGRLDDFQHHVFGYDEAFARDNGFRLLWRSPEYATDEEAYMAVLERDDAIIVSYIYSTDRMNQDMAHKVGDTMSLHLGDETLDYEIVGIQEQFHHSAVWLPKDLVQGLFPVTEGVYLYRLEPGADATEVARELEQQYRAVGMDADDARAEVLRQQESFRNILSAMKLFLGLGLIVGVLSLGIVTSRSVLERRQEIGMMRALGYTGRQIRWMFFTEVTYTLLLGALAGIACAILVTYGLWYAVIRELQYPYVIPWGEIALLVLVSYVVALMATAAPIRRSAKVAPAEALRYVE